MFVAPIVEGFGEVKAVPAPLHRLHQRTGAQGLLQVYRPLRVMANRFVRDEGCSSKFVRLAGERAAPERGCVLILLDCEDHCPAELGPILLQRARTARADVPIVVALAYREYETWFLAAAR